MNILMIGHNDPAGMMIAFANAINRYTEHTARVIAFEQRYAADYEYDILVSLVENDDYGEIEHCLRHADIIHFHMTLDEYTAIGPLRISDYIKGKAILHHHHGHPDFRAYPERFREKYLRLKRKCIVSTPDLLKLLPEASWQPNIVPIFDADYLPRRDHIGKQEHVKIVHSPTRRYLKNTEEFCRIMDELLVSYAYAECLVLEGFSLRECLKRKRNCHIAFDHMQGYFGVSSLESLAHGLPVIAGIDEFVGAAVREQLGAGELPWVVARNSSELKKALDGLISNPDLRREVGSGSRSFMERHWTEQQVLGSLIRTYESL